MTCRPLCLQILLVTCSPFGKFLATCKQNKFIKGVCYCVTFNRYVNRPCVNLELVWLLYGSATPFHSIWPQLIPILPCNRMKKKKKKLNAVTVICIFVCIVHSFGQKIPDADILIFFFWSVEWLGHQIVVVLIARHHGETPWEGQSTVYVRDQLVQPETLMRRLLS